MRLDRGQRLRYGPPLQLNNKHFKYFRNESLAGVWMLRKCRIGLSFVMIAMSLAATLSCGSGGDDGSTPTSPSTPAPPATPPPPSGMSSLTFAITDGCSDGRGLQVKFFDTTNNLLWPSATEV